jgi:ABC-type protease/lipase transport system fused ATPase/permease subunit
VRYPKAVRRADVMFGTAWRAAPLLCAACTCVAIVSSALLVTYPLGFRAIVDGANEHDRHRIIVGLVLVLVAVAFPGSWVLQLVGGALNVKLNDLTNIRLGMRVGGLASGAPYLEHYPGQDTLAVSGIDLALAAGSTVAIVGENGAGKSTLIKLLTGMYRPDSGTITVDGQDLATVAPPRWRAATTGAFQDFVRMHMSLADGVGAGDLTRVDDRETVRGAVERGGADQLVAELPDGLDTMLGPYIGGRSLSGGQWQRLALSRGLMRARPLLIVLDEPTASLDAASEAALFTSYREAARTLGETNGAITVLVSHRFSTVHMADTIVVMDDGKIAEAGDHDTLMAVGGLYAELFTLQAAGYQ